MGKVYDDELSQVQETALWASRIDLSKATDGLTNVLNRELFVVASGGSVAAAQLLAQLQASLGSRIAVVKTPLEYITEPQPAECAVWFISAGGSNNDILEAWRTANRRRTGAIALICGSTNSPLAQLAAKSSCSPCLVFDLPAGRDGFLATNSLIAFCCIFLRLYGMSVPDIEAYRNALEAKEIADRSSLIVLYGGWLKAAAIDIESRFSEAALGAVQIADFRNFAHGRHHWIAKRGSETALLALVSPRFASLARDTLANLPSSVRIDRWEFQSEDASIALLAIHRSMVLAGNIARARGYDAGRPGVPEFGHRIYALITPAEPSPTLDSTQLAIDRKMRAAGLPPNRDTSAFRDGLSQFQATLTSATLGGIVLDYDGTIVDTKRRFEPIESRMAAEIERLLEEGLSIGIATGRGKSVHESLRIAISPDLWSRVWIGYYNGTVVRSLESACDCAAVPALAVIEAATEALRSSSDMRGAAIEPRPTQITITQPGLPENRLWMKVRNVLDINDVFGVQVVHSTHSVDVISKDASKTAVTRMLASSLNNVGMSILNIGDRGLWPGNDAALLAQALSVSVDEVSGDPNTCWNLVPQGLFGLDATLFYLQRVKNRRYNASS